MTVVEEDSLAIETTQARLSDHDGWRRQRRRRRLGLGFFFSIKLGALIPYYERLILLLRELRYIYIPI